MLKQFSIFNFQFSSEKGFTLVELLAVIFVFITVGTIIMSILVSALRGNNKTNVINGVVGNGNYAITQIQRSIHSAIALEPTFSCGTVNVPTSTSVLKLLFPNGVITYSCVDSNNNLTLSSNSASLIDTNTISVVSCKFTCGQDTAGGYPVIGIDFSLQEKGSSNFSEQKASVSAVEFQTSVIMRNAIR